KRSERALSTLASRYQRLMNRPLRFSRSVTSRYNPPTTLQNTRPTTRKKIVNTVPVKEEVRARTSRRPNLNVSERNRQWGASYVLSNGVVVRRDLDKIGIY